MPVLSGFSNYLWPLLLGSRDMAFPRAERAFLLALSVLRPVPLRELLHRARAERRLVQLRALCTPTIQSRAEHRFLCAGHDLPRHLDDGRLGQFHRHRCCARARPGMSINRVPILVWGTLTASVANLLVGARGQPRLLSAVAGPPVRHAFLRAAIGRPAAALAAPVLDVRRIPGSTPSCCRRWAWSPTGCRSSAAGRSSATRWWRCRRWRRWCSASASGCTTCSRPACRSGAVVLQRRVDHHRGPERGRRLRLDRDDLDGPAGLHHGVPVLRRLDRRCS